MTIIITVLYNYNVVLIKKVKLPTWLSILWIFMIVTVLLGTLASVPLTIFGKSNFINNPQHYVYCMVYNHDWAFYT